MPGTIIVGVILLAVIGIAVYSTVKRIKYGSYCCGSKDPMPKKVKVKDKNKTHYPYAYRMKVDGMHCSGCVRNIENAFHQTTLRGCCANLIKRNAPVVTDNYPPHCLRGDGLI